MKTSKNEQCSNNFYPSLIVAQCTLQRIHIFSIKSSSKTTFLPSMQLAESFQLF